MKLISFDIKSNFGFFRKPETNNTINISYNIIHKPAILGILGAIIGLEGYKEKGKLPEYYTKLRDVQIGIEPLCHDRGNYQKTLIKYSNTVGYANKGATFLTEELTLISPSYRVYLLLDQVNKLHLQLIENISQAKSEFIPYFGKNEFTAWWNPKSYKSHKFELVSDIDKSIQIKSLFIRKQNVTKNSEAAEVDMLSVLEEESPFMFFERLPKKFDEQLMQYELEEMVYSNYGIKNAENLPNLFYLTDEDCYVQLH